VAFSPDGQSVLSKERYTGKKRVWMSPLENVFVFF